MNSMKLLVAAVALLVSVAAAPCLAAERPLSGEWSSRGTLTRENGRFFLLVTAGAASRKLVVIGATPEITEALEKHTQGILNGLPVHIHGRGEGQGLVVNRVGLTGAPGSPHATDSTPGSGWKLLALAEQAYILGVEQVRDAAPGLEQKKLALERFEECSRLLTAAQRDSSDPKLESVLRPLVRKTNLLLVELRDELKSP